MATRTQSRRSGAAGLEVAASVDSHAFPRVQQEDIDVGGAEWLNSTGENGHRSVRLQRRYVRGRWVQITYALIDVICVLANAVIAFLLRFSSDHLRFGLVLERLALRDQPVAHYDAFLLLYVALILLFCHLQDLYRTPRDRPSAKETLAVVKAVSFATLLLAAFIYLSGVKIVSRSVVVTSLMLNTVALVSWRYAKRRLVFVGPSAASVRATP